jgi:hypothetical protein
MSDTLNKYFNALAKHLKEKSLEICEDNQCTEDGHNCESYAYFVKDESDKYNLVDICASDYVQSHTWIPVSLPFQGTGKELLDAIEDNDCLDI